MKRLAIAILVMAAGTHARADNLDLDVDCADYWATPDDGLDVRVDGRPVQGEVNSTLGVAYSRHGNPHLTLVPINVGFTVAPGSHDVAIAAPGCAALATRVSLGAMATLVSGRLPIDDASLLGPVGAPNGWGVALGATMTSRAAHTWQGLGLQSYANDQTTDTGVWITATHEHRGVELAWDNTVGTGSTAGVATWHSTLPGSMPVSTAYTGSELQLRSVMRIGARLPERTFALAAGTGFGGDMFVESGSLTDQAAFTAGTDPHGFDDDLFVPLWASLTIKPSCSWGAQVYGSYDVYPTAMAQDAPSIAAGLEWQPSDACSQASGLSVR